MNSKSTTCLLLVRHGRTEFNAQGRVQGGGKLDTVGQAQVQALVERLRAEELAAVYSSPLTRTLQTARAIARDRGLPVRQRRLLRDIDYGVFSGTLFADARVSDPALWRRWRDAPHTVSFPQGESLAVLRGRLERFLDEMKGWQGGRTVLAATHDSPIRTLCCIAQGLDDSHHHEYVAGVASITTLMLTPDGPRLLSHNDTMHLRGIDGA